MQQGGDNGLAAANAVSDQPVGPGVAVSWCRQPGRLKIKGRSRTLGRRSVLYLDEGPEELHICSTRVRIPA